MQKQESINLKSTIKSLTTESYATKSNSNERPETNSFSLKNKLNELTGKEWMKFTKSWFIHRPQKRKDNEILHPAKYPESLIKEFLCFFTKSNEWILDPFLGTGSTLVAAKECDRNAIGIELLAKYYNIAQKRINETQQNLLTKQSQQITIQGDSTELIEIFKEKDLLKHKIKFCITSPPYWNQLKKNNIRQKNRKEQGLDTEYSNKEIKDIGNIEDYKQFIEKQAQIFDLVYDVLVEKSYLVIITNNVFARGRLYPLAYDTAISLTQRKNKNWILKDEKIWCQDDKSLLPLGIYNAWVGNRCHQYCLIFRKESE